MTNYTKESFLVMYQRRFPLMNAVEQNGAFYGHAQDHYESFIAGYDACVALFSKEVHYRALQMHREESND